MNVQDLFNEITQKHAKHVADLVDSSAYAYLTQQMEYLRSKGEDLTTYEVVIARDEWPKVYDEGDGRTWRIDQRIRLMKTEDLQRLRPIEATEE